MNKLSKDEKKQISAAALLEVVAGVVNGPVGIWLPIIGNIILNVKDNKDLKKQIESLEENQQDQIKEALEKFYDTLVAERSMYVIEMYYVDALEIFFRMELNKEELNDISEWLSDYCGDEGICLEDDILCCNGDIEAAIDSYYILQNSLIINLVEPCKKENVMELVDLVGEIIEQNTHINTVKKVVFY